MPASPLIARPITAADEAAVLALARDYVAEIDANGGWLTERGISPDDAHLLLHSRLYAARETGCALLLHGGARPAVCGFLLALSRAGHPSVPADAWLVCDLYVAPVARRGAAARPLWVALRAAATAESRVQRLITNARADQQRLLQMLHMLGFRRCEPLPFDEPRNCWLAYPVT